MGSESSIEALANPTMASDRRGGIDPVSSALGGLSERTADALSPVLDALKSLRRMLLLFFFSARVASVGKRHSCFNYSATFFPAKTERYHFACV